MEKYEPTPEEVEKAEEMTGEEAESRMTEEEKIKSIDKEVTLEEGKKRGKRELLDAGDYGFHIENLIRDRCLNEEAATLLRDLKVKYESDGYGSNKIRLYDGDKISENQLLELAEKLHLDFISFEPRSGKASFTDVFTKNVLMQLHEVDQNIGIGMGYNNYHDNKLRELIADPDIKDRYEVEVEERDSSAISYIKGYLRGKSFQK